MSLFAVLMNMVKETKDASEWSVLDRSFVSPTRGVKKFPTRSRERFLTADERATLDRFLENALTIPSNRAEGLR